MKKPINYLASKHEQLSNIKLPFQQQFQQLSQLTEQVTQAWQFLLPEELLATLMVYGFDEQTMSISTHSHTIANYLNYHHQHLLQQLHQQSNLQSVKKLHFRVVYLEKTYATTQNALCNQNVKNVTSCEFSESTKQNITQLAQFVTDNEQLKEQLMRLANS